MNKPFTAYSARHIVKWLWQSSIHNRLQAILNTIIGLFEVVVSLASVWAVKRAIDIASHNQEGDVLLAVAVMAGLIMLAYLLSAASTWVRNVLGTKAQNRMQRAMLGRILRSEWRGREAMHTGDVMNRLEQDVNTVVTFVAETLPNAVAIFALFMGAFWFLYSMDHSLALLILIVFPAFLILSKVYVRRMRQLSREVRDSDSLVQSILQESVQHRTLVKTLESEDLMICRLDNEQSTLQRKVERRTWFTMGSNLIVNIGFAAGYLLAFAWSALRMYGGSLTFGGMTAFLQLVNKIQNPARSLSRLAPQFVQVFTAAERLMLFEDIPLEEQGDPIRLSGVCGVRLDDVSYYYDDDRHKVIINHMTHDFRPGTCTAIIGETGSGKTTLIRLVLALIRPTEGSVTLYGDSGTAIASPLTRCNILYVPQGNTMISGSIRDNLLMGNENATDSEMYEALDTACADFVRNLPDGLDTVCSEGGGGLSEGQAQRVCIARALLRNSSILILDEATSALDPATEKMLLDNLLRHKRHTVIFVTHRLSVLDYCDDSLRF